jgi:hypothetical protein
MGVLLTMPFLNTVQPVRTEFLRAEPRPGPPTPPTEPVPAPAPPNVIALEAPYSRRKKCMPCLINALLTTKKRLAL